MVSLDGSDYKSREFKLLTLEHLWNGLSSKDRVLRLLKFLERTSLTTAFKIAIPLQKIYLATLKVFTILSLMSGITDKAIY